MRADPHRIPAYAKGSSITAVKNVLADKRGFGAAPLGNMFGDLPQDEARATVQAPFDVGIRYYDNAPFSALIKRETGT